MEVLQMSAIKNDTPATLFDSFKETDDFIETGFGVFDSSGNLISFNDTFAILLNKNSDEIKETNILSIFNINDKNFSSLVRNHAVSRNILIDDRHLHVSICKVFCKDAEDRFFALINDKTAERVMIDSLNINLEQIKLLIDKFNLGFVILDEYHNIVEANNTFCHNLGYSQSEAIKLNAKDFIVDFEKRHEIQNPLENQTFFFGDDNMHIKKNGKHIPIKGYGSLTRINNQRVALCFYENISEQVESYKRLETSEMMLKNFISNSTDVIMVVNKDLEISYLSPNTSKVFGYSDNIPRSEIQEKYLPIGNHDFKKFIKANLNTRESSIEYEYTIRSKSGKFKYFSIRTSTIKLNEKLVICYIRDVTKDKKYIEELKILSYTDQLTKLHNRQFMEEQLIELRKIENYPISIISADLDGLKEVNDSLGHQAGDELLRRFANILIESHENYDEIFRIGGDEFLILATKTNEATAAKIIKKIDSKISKHNSLPSSLLKISASVGFSTSDKSNTNLSTMLALADREMYKIKNEKKLLNRNGE